MEMDVFIAPLRALIALASVYACWWALQALRFDRMVSEPGSRQAKLLHLVLAVVLGHQFSAFIIDYLDWTVLR